MLEDTDLLRVRIISDPTIQNIMETEDLTASDFLAIAQKAERNASGKATFRKNPQRYGASATDERAVGL